MADKREAPRGDGQTHHHPFFALATLALLVAICALAKDVIVPLALSGIIAFALNPAVRGLERWIGRRIAVGLVVLAALTAVSAFGYTLNRQFVELSTQVTRYSGSMRKKIAALKIGDQGGLGALSRGLDRVIEGVDERVAESGRASPVKIISPKESAASRVESAIEPVLAPLGKTVIVLVLVVFLLFQHEDLRDRFIRLLGRRNLTLTTRTMDEAGRRISRFLLTQSAVNAGYGAIVTLALLWIGIPYAPLWGVAAAVLRFVPFVGTILAALPPLLLAFVQFPGWGHTFAVMVFFVGIDLLAAYAIEPLMIGRKVGVSSIAMVVMAIFWTWLWGPIGLVLSTPLTVCLTVLGRQVTRLEFLAILLGDEPALEAELAFYQRLLAGDEDEAGEILEKQRQGRGAQAMLGEVLVPALLMAERDRAAGRISEVDRDHFLRATDALLSEAFDSSTAHTPAPVPLAVTAENPTAPALRVLGVPARNPADELLWKMVVHTFDDRPVLTEMVPAATLASEVGALAQRLKPHLICITSVPPGGLAHARYLCKRLRARLPEVPILVVRPVSPHDGGDGGEGPRPFSTQNDQGVSLVGSLAQVAMRAELLRPDYLPETPHTRAL
jgi:predicted PurR-regulated permease PerM